MSFYPEHDDDAESSGWAPGGIFGTAAIADAEETELALDERMSVEKPGKYPLDVDIAIAASEALRRRQRVRARARMLMVERFIDEMPDARRWAWGAARQQIADARASLIARLDPNRFHVPSSPFDEAPERTVVGAASARAAERVFDVVAEIVRRAHQKEFQRMETAARLGGVDRDAWIHARAKETLKKPDAFIERLAARLYRLRAAWAEPPLDPVEVVEAQVVE